MNESCSEWQKLKCYMETEKILLTAYSEKSRELRSLVRSMDWPTLDIELRELDDLTCQIDEIDRRRARSYEIIRKNNHASRNMDFFELSRSVNEELRDELRALHNHLRIITDRVRVESRVTSAYVEARNQSLHDMLGELIPETKNVFYTPAGQTVKGSTGSSSLLVNRHL